VARHLERLGFGQIKGPSIISFEIKNDNRIIDRPNKSTVVTNLSSVFIIFLSLLFILHHNRVSFADHHHLIDAEHAKHFKGKKKVQ